MADKTHRYVYPGCNTRERLHRWGPKSLADWRCCFGAYTSLPGVAPGWVEDRAGNRDDSAGRMGALARATPGRWDEVIRHGQFGLRCVCGRTATSPRNVERHVCAVWAALTLGARG